MGTLLKITIVGVLLALLGERIMNLCFRVRLFTDFHPVELPNCQLVKGMECGSEDLEILPNGLAFITTGLKYPGLISFAPDKPGEILLLDLNDGSLNPSPLRISKGFDSASFNPHGISLYTDEKAINRPNSGKNCPARSLEFMLIDIKGISAVFNDGSVYVFVVNHPHMLSIVEIFKFVREENTLVHLKSVKHKLLNSINGIVAVGPESFYATNDYYFSNFNMKMVELLLGLSWTGIVYYSPGDVRHVAMGFYSGNGMAISNDRKYIYAVDLTGHTLNVFEKHKDWSLTPVKSVEVDMLLDNLSVDPVTGDIWTAGHPNLLKVFRYDPEDLPGSQVIRFQNILSDNPIITTVYANNGSVIQAGSCASVYKGQLLVGTVFHRALHCQLE